MDFKMNSKFYDEINSYKYEGQSNNRNFNQFEIDNINLMREEIRVLTETQKNILKAQGNEESAVKLVRQLIKDEVCEQMKLVNQKLNEIELELKNYRLMKR